MSKPSPGPGRTEAASAGSAMKERALDMTIRTVAAVLWASERSSARVRAQWRAPTSVRICSGRSGSAPETQAATARRSYPASAAAWK
jgi:ethanolamine ammonia-lyase small subunit